MLRAGRTARARFLARLVDSIQRQHRRGATRRQVCFDYQLVWFCLWPPLKSNYRCDSLRCASLAAVRRLSRAARETIVNDHSKSFAPSAQGAASARHRSCANVDGSAFLPSQVPRCRRDRRPHVTDRVRAQREPSPVVAPQRDEDTVPRPTGPLTTAYPHTTRRSALTRLRAYLCLGSSRLIALRRHGAAATLIFRKALPKYAPSSLKDCKQVRAATSLCSGDVVEGEKKRKARRRKAVRLAEWNLHNRLGARCNFDGFHLRLRRVH